MQYRRPVGLRPVVEHVPEVPTACGADDLGARHAVARVDALLDRVERRRLHEARPPGPGVELRVGAEELRATARAAVDTRILGVGVRAGEGSLGRLPAEDRVLVGRQSGAPLLVRELDRARHA